MKHSGDFPFQAGLPDAPLHMPKQQLEHHRSFMSALRATFWPFSGR